MSTNFIDIPADEFLDRMFEATEEEAVKLYMASIYDNDQEGLSPVQEARRKPFLQEQRSLEFRFEKLVEQSDVLFRAFRKMSTEDSFSTLAHFVDCINDPLVLKRECRVATVYRETNFPPLGLIIQYYDKKAFDQIMKKYKANVRVRSKKGCPVIFLAAAADNDDFVTGLLARDPDLLKEYSEHGIVDYVMRHPSTLSLFRNSDFTGGDGEKKGIKEWFEGNFEDTKPLTLKYYGPVSRINQLAEAGASVIADDKDGISPLAKAEDPKKLFKNFLADNEFITRTSNITLNKDSTFTFEALIYNQGKTQSRKATITCDYQSKLLPQLRKHASKQQSISDASNGSQEKHDAHVQLLQQIRTEQKHQAEQLEAEKQRLIQAQQEFKQSAEAMQRRVAELEHRTDEESKKMSEITQLLESKLSFEARFKKLNSHIHSEKMFDLASRKLGALFGVWKDLSTGETLRAKNTGTDTVSSLVGLGDNLPTPFSWIFSGLRACIDHKADKDQEERYKAIMEVLPRKELEQYCDELACMATEIAINHLKKLRGEDALDRISRESSVKIGTYCLGIMAYAVYNIKSLGIKADLTAVARSQELRRKTLMAVTTEPKLVELLETIAKDSITPPHTPEGSKKVAPPLPPKPINFALDLSKAEEANRQLQEKKKSMGLLGRAAQGLQDKYRTHQLLSKAGS